MVIARSVTYCGFAGDKGFTFQNLMPLHLIYWIRTPRL
ncbi:Hypothetical protein FNO222_0811 [Francisella orientalis]|uniref:Uncharacterized protein n=1 Tax=Francisella orientalis TaxID=299583 RepID=A0ABM5U6L0_9GAMM|nr:hypothetical protein FNO12_0807 [Francisella orientalis FNO12]AKN87030.1 Hypothetical protein FNO24_0807 [Francisella orientalis FNO24]AKN88568.1 Hypothetical protein FNO190_0807 [Francisella orientalis]AKU05324.1 Hypothetical protein FNO01_0807 [Francisella orientalis]QEN20234.1 Hypothetical protein FNO39_0811 [Francisella orientalis]